MRLRVRLGAPAHSIDGETSALTGNNFRSDRMVNVTVDESDTQERWSIDEAASDGFEHNGKWYAKSMREALLGDDEPATAA